MIHEGVHYGRSEQKLLQEFMCFRDQLNLSGDDMNTIQMGRTAVSRYHQPRKFFGTGVGPKTEIHDFPSAEYGIGMGGFMVLGGRLLNRKKGVQEC